MKYEFLANVILKGKIEVLTGLHIGGSKEKLEIGGVDSPVIRDPFTNYPYIPGSSIKGKMRMLLEFANGKVTNGKPHKSDDIHDEVCRIFGNFKDDTKGGPTRLTTRDAFPDKQTIDKWEKLDSELTFTEFKPENSIDRLTSEANPRFLERVVKGSFFDVEFVYSIYNEINDEIKD
ncbi:MAG TPA: type III-A CRISPR-associated RAMP protein Csm3, partial [Melioribacteraceae bacterium]|nr:type III-A CRISPR-associated RAMP protein Csm3 [Melioribacteraceae bacterium]